jgi:hypothetical protein
MPVQGRIKKFLPDKNIGWVSRADGSEVFIPPTETPRSEPRMEGDEIGFDVIPDPKREGKFQATHVTSIRKVPRTPPPPQGELEVEWEKFGTPRKVSSETGDYLQFSVWIKLSKGSHPVPGAEVSLNVNAQAAALPDISHTDAKGRVSFVAYLQVEESEEVDCLLTARVNEKDYTYLWENPLAVKPPKAEEPPAESQTPTELNVKKSGPDADGVYTFEFPVKHGQQVSVHGKKREFEVEARLAGTPVWVSGPFTAETDGTMKLEVRAKTEGIGEVFFEAGGLKSRPRYIERRKQN